MSFRGAIERTRDRIKGCKDQKSTPKAVLWWLLHNLLSVVKASAMLIRGVKLLLLALQESQIRKLYIHKNLYIALQNMFKSQKLRKIKIKTKKDATFQKMCK
ncbi:hypothetical protein ABKV19_003878 [Rosa sericea]